jgi:hypothetical protein
MTTGTRAAVESPLPTGAELLTVNALQLPPVLPPKALA